MNLTDRAMRHFEETYDMARLPMPGTLVVEMAEWAASLPPTDEEVLAALNADYAIRHPHTIPADSLEPYNGETVRIMRAALAAAQRARSEA